MNITAIIISTVFSVLMSFLMYEQNYKFKFYIQKKFKLYKKDLFFNEKENIFSLLCIGSDWDFSKNKHRALGYEFDTNLSIENALNTGVAKKIGFYLTYKLYFILKKERLNKEYNNMQDIIFEHEQQVLDAEINFQKTNALVSEIKAELANVKKSSAFSISGFRSDVKHLREAFDVFHKNVSNEIEVHGKRNYEKEVQENGDSKVINKVEEYMVQLRNGMLKDEVAFIELLTGIKRGFGERHLDYKLRAYNEFLHKTN